MVVIKSMMRVNCKNKILYSIETSRSVKLLRFKKVCLKPRAWDTKTHLSDKKKGQYIPPTNRV